MQKYQDFAYSRTNWLKSLAHRIVSKWVSDSGAQGGAKVAGQIVQQLLIRGQIFLVQNITKTLIQTFAYYIFTS